MIIDSALDAREQESAANSRARLHKSTWVWRASEAPDDAAGITRALGDIARAAGMSDVAKATGLSRESLYRALSLNGNPSFATILKVARAVGVRLHAEVSPSRRD